MFNIRVIIQLTAVTQALGIKGESQYVHSMNCEMTQGEAV